MPMDKMILKTNYRSFQRQIGQYIVYLAELKGKLSIQISKNYSQKISRYEMTEDLLPDDLKNLYGTIQNLYDYMDANQNSIVNIDRNQIVVKTYLNKNCTVGLLKGTTIVM